LSLDKLIQEFVHGGWVLELLIVRRERLQKKREEFSRKGRKARKEERLFAE